MIDTVNIVLTWKIWIHENGISYPQTSFRNGNLAKSCVYVDDNGEEITWFENGNISGHSMYKNSILHGDDKLWFSNGQLWHHYIYRDGKLHGQCNEWYPNGQPLRQTTY
jgi:antitoxin component YwqK of YwqJK toxin-antitoxin module